MTDAGADLETIAFGLLLLSLSWVILVALALHALPRGRRGLRWELIQAGLAAVPLALLLTPASLVLLPALQRLPGPLLGGASPLLTLWGSCALAIAGWRLRGGEEGAA